MYHIFFYFPLLFAFLISGCSPVTVNYDYDPAVDFSTVKTYSWGQPNTTDDELARNPLLQKRIAASVDRYLQARGFSLVDPGQADVLIVMQAMIKEKMQVTDWGGPRGYYRDPWYDPWWGGSAYGGRVDVSYYNEGTLVIDIVDSRKKELIWRGLGSSIVQSYKDPEKQQAAIDKYVQEILDHFPPGYEKKSK
jgi:hypothetical protein